AEARVFLDGGATPIWTREVEIDPQGKNIQHVFSLDLKTLALSNQDHQLRAEFVVTDNRAQRSDALGPTVISVDVSADPDGPKAAIRAPLPGTSLYGGSRIDVAWKVLDETAVSSVILRANGQIIGQVSPGIRATEGQVSYVVPDVESASEV